jgi:hypothetical protein
VGAFAQKARSFFGLAFFLRMATDLLEARSANFLPNAIFFITLRAWS